MGIVRNWGKGNMKKTLVLLVVGLTMLYDQPAFSGEYDDLAFAGKDRDAGYGWASGHHIQDTSFDNGNSESFNEGVRQYAKEAGQYAKEIESALYQDRYVLLLKTTKDYREAANFSKNACKALTRPFDNQDIKYTQEKGVYFSETINDEMYAGGYAPRRYSGEDISIENSDAYNGFAPGYLIVVGGIYNDAVSAKKALLTVREFYPDAYIKKTVMWMGCIH